MKVAIRRGEKAGRRIGVVFAGPSTVALLLLGAAVHPMGGCMTTEQMAPPVGAEFADVAIRRGVSLATLDAGRRTYLDACSRCHAIEPIGRYSKKAWRGILPRMMDEARLDGTRKQDVTTYVLSAWDVLGSRRQDGRE